MQSCAKWLQCTDSQPTLRQRLSSEQCSNLGGKNRSFGESLKVVFFYTFHSLTTFHQINESYVFYSFLIFVQLDKVKFFFVFLDST